MECTTKLTGKENSKLECFVGRSQGQVLVPEPVSTRAPGDYNAVVTTSKAGWTGSRDVLPDGHGSESHFLPLVPQKPSPNSSVKTDHPNSPSTAGHVADECYAHTRRPRRSFSTDFKLKAVLYYKQGNTKAATAKHFGIHRKRIQEWILQEDVLRCSPSNRRRMTQTMAGGSKAGKGEVQSEGSVKGADGSPSTATEQTESGLSHDDTLTHIQTIPTVPLQLAASEVDGVGTPMSACFVAVLPTTGGIPAGRRDTMQNTTPAGACSGVSLNQPAHHVPPFPSPQTTPSPIPSSHTTAPSISLAQATQPAIPPSHTTSSPVPNVSSHLPASKATLESNIAFLRSLSDESVGTLLDAMNLSKYKAKFLAEQVDGELLFSLGESELRELGVESGLHQLKLLKLVQGIYSAETFLRKAR